MQRAGDMVSDGEPLLAPSLLARLERLQLGTRRRLAGEVSGEHRSPEHGETLDFAEYREYYPGDDFRRIDYQALARLDQLLVRVFEAEDDLTVRLVVDTSASMAGSKLRQAARVAGALGFVALSRRDAVTLHTFPGRHSSSEASGAGSVPVARPAPRFTGRHGAHALLRHLEGLEASGTTALAAAVQDMLSRPGPRGLTVVVSDLLTPEWQDGLTRLPARGGDVVVAHVLAANELRPDLAGDLDLVDMESGQRVPVSLTPDMLREYRQLVQGWMDDVEQRCHQLGAAYVRVLDDDDLEHLLLSRWRSLGVLR